MLRPRLIYNYNCSLFGSFGNGFSESNVFNEFSVCSVSSFEISIPSMQGFSVCIVSGICRINLQSLQRLQKGLQNLQNLQTLQNLQNLQSVQNLQSLQSL